MYGNGLLTFYEKRTWTLRFRLSGKEMGVAGAEEGTKILSELS